MLLFASTILTLSLPAQAPEAPEAQEPEAVAPVVVDIPVNQEPDQADIEAEALAAWLAEDGPEWDSPTGQFVRDMSFGLTLDLMAEFTEKEDSIEEYNDMRMRSAQMHFASPVMGTGHAFATLDLSDGGNGSDLLLREAGVWVEDFAGDFLPGRLDAQVGKYLADLGAWNTVMAHEFPAPSLDSTRRSFLGGNLVMTGVELHHGMPIQDGWFRWSAGLAGDVESHDADEFANGVSASTVDPVGRRGFSNWAGTARASLQLNFGSGMSGRAGSSLYYAPEMPIFTEVGGSVERLDAHNHLRGIDLGFVWAVPDSTQSHELSFELWVNDSQYRASADTLRGDKARGEWLMYQFVYDARWSAGALFSRHDVLGLSLMDIDAAYHSGFLTYSVNENNRVTFFLTHTNPGFSLEKFFTVGGQWTIDLGAKRDNSVSRWN